jgi:predicted hydrocarbon binding protein
MNGKSRQKCMSILERTEYFDDDGEWRIGGSDWLLMSGATLRSWAKVTEQILGSGSKAIMYAAGVRAGEQFAKTLETEGLKGEELTYALEIFLTNGGWGKVRAKVNFEKQTAMVRIHNSVTTRSTMAKEPVCNFISGYIAGTLSAIFGNKTDCVESSCKAMGDSFCEFRAARLTNVKNAHQEKEEGQNAKDAR